MEHTVAVGDVLAIWGTKDADGVERTYKVMPHERATAYGSCDRTEHHLHLGEITIMHSGYVNIVHVHFGDALTVDGVRHEWHAPGGDQFLLIPAS